MDFKIAVIAKNNQQYQFFLERNVDQAFWNHFKLVNRYKDTLGCRFTAFIEVEEYWEVKERKEIIEYIVSHYKHNKLIT